MATTPSINVNLGMRIAKILNPSFGVMSGPKVLAKYFCETLLTIANEGLPVKIYLDHRVTEAIAPLLKELGVKFRTVSPNSMKLPYIYLFLGEEEGRLVIETVDTDLKECRYVTRFDLFLEELTSLIVEIRRKKKEKPEPRVEILLNMTLEKFMKFTRDIIKEE